VRFHTLETLSEALNTLLAEHSRANAEAVPAEAT
jgi:hypothetical protein